MIRKVANDRRRASGMGRALHALSPLAVLERGFAVLQREGGGIVRSAEEVGPGDALVARLARGTLRVRVEARPSDEARRPEPG